uniref:Fibronectin type-III domain-containing protein n=1 Tax=Amphilophus citrinellus TaxID=61819 RepID=A0A3Q0SNH8_AMPCI
ESINRLYSLCLYQFCMLVLCYMPGCYLPKPNITHLKAINDKQSLVVSWLVKPSGFVADVYDIQISRTEKGMVSVYSAEHKWTWISDLPLECVDHSVRIRYYNQSVQSPWSSWVTNYGEKGDGTRIFPSGRVLREGSSAMFCCVPPTGVNITSMTFRNEQYPFMSIGARVKAITVNNLTIPKIVIKHLLLSCFDTTGKSSHVLNYISFPPQKPRNLSCATLDMVTVTCTWDSARKQDPYDRNSQIYTLHIENSDQAPVNCKQSSCTFPAVPHLEEYNISVMVKDELGEEVECYSFNISDRVFPVVTLLEVNPGVTDATASWSIQANLTQMNLLCQVATVPLDTIQVNSFSNSASGVCKAKLEHLFPNTNYSIRVRCTISGRLWGEWTQLKVFTTYPLVYLDLWRSIHPLSNSHHRQVTLLWNPHIAGTATTVNIQGYTVKWSQEGQTVSKDSRQSLVEVSIGPEKCNFTVQAVLPTGSSIPAHISIPPAVGGIKTKRLDSTTVGGFNLTWEEQSIATCGYTVEWCMLGNAVPCTLQWLKVPEGNSTLFLHARHFRVGYRYTFNIYGCTDNGDKLLEIQTGYSQELKFVQSPSLVEPVQSTSSSVTLEWHYNEEDPTQPAFITGYLVTVQEAGSVSLPDLFNVSVADPHMKSVTIEGLKQNTEYTCTVSALTKEGPGLPANITIRTKTNYSLLMLKILTPIFLLLGCTVLLWPQRKILKSGLKEIFVYPAFMNIKTPEFESFLHETDQWLQSQKPEECISCDIEILNVRPPLNEGTTLRDSELAEAPCSPSSQSLLSSSSPSCMLLEANYCPQSATQSLDKPASQQVTSIVNRSYLYTLKEGYPELPKLVFGEIRPIFEATDCPLESCEVIYGYIANDSL